MSYLKKISLSCFPYPFLFAIYPILALWNTNFFQMDSIEVLKPLVLLLLISPLLFLVLKIAFHSWNKSALFTSLVIFLFFTFGHTLNLLSKNSLLGVTTGKPRNLLLLWVVIFLGLGYVILRYGKKTDSLNQLLNFFGFVLILIVTIQIGYKAFQPAEIVRLYRHDTYTANVKSPPAKLVAHDDSPDVYLIVLDGYLRDDKLQKSYSFNNNEFLQQLRDLGFVIPSCAQSNYTSTALAMSSELNMDYLDALGINIQPDANGLDYNLLSKYIRHSLVREEFYQMGYKMVSFDTSFPFMNFLDADVYFHENSSLWKHLTGTTEFDDQLSASTVLSLNNYFQVKFPTIADQISEMQDEMQSFMPLILGKGTSSYQIRYNIIMNQLKEIQTVPAISGKKFVYLHVPAPHAAANSRFILAADGSFNITTDQYKGYVDEIKFLNARIIPILKGIIDNSSKPPIIILQGDHGWKYDPTIRTTILNAYYLPSGGDKLIYPSITPVNTFRTIFNYYFEGQFEKLEDTSYYSDSDNFSKITQVPVICPR